MDTLLELPQMLQTGFYGWMQRKRDESMLSHPPLGGEEPLLSELAMWNTSGFSSSFQTELL